MTLEVTDGVSGVPAGLSMRVLEPEGWDAFYDALERAFGGGAESAEEREVWRSVSNCDRFIGVYDGNDVVGTAGVFSFRLTVPGGESVRAGGVTMVSVQPTHRRRGVLRSMMRRQLDDIRAAGEPLAMLTASEPPIYGRFGYGNASDQLSATIDTGRVRLALPEGTDRVRLRIAEPVEVRGECERIYAARVPSRPGMLARQPGWEAVPILDPPSGREGASPLLCVTAELDGKLSGYARYSVKSRWDSAGPNGSVVLRDLEALDPVSGAALWDFLFGIDLTSTLVVRNRPSDDPLLHLVSDIRRCRVAIRDSCYIRLVDVGRALAARTYTAPVDVVLDVADSFCPWNEGRWRLSGDAKGAACEPSKEPADLALSVRELASVYLGGVPLTALAGAGRVRELRQGALAEASAAFRGLAEPWLPHGF
ncbi:GNAT family N-acetyltransferase [Wenjunlia tyrosinilytica]|uniref:UPF0256 protein n=1 Tax=Wenjunlia tyrosinilytica TaxID=1544741 RepID=A0A918DSU6_9ACTN|nr:GNAT family N-acetyltransferase [Wenjunlia tyrosinilytica]GGO80940.1 UPF0256 protein [Wenjunlia tyrosinilytica]